MIRRTYSLWLWLPAAMLIFWCLPQPMLAAENDIYSGDVLTLLATSDQEQQQQRRGQTMDTTRTRTRQDTGTTRTGTQRRGGMGDTTLQQQRRGGMGTGMGMGQQQGSVLRRSSDTVYQRGTTADTLFIHDTLILIPGAGSRMRGGGMFDTSMQQRRRGGGTLDTSMQQRRRGGIRDTSLWPSDTTMRRGGVRDTMMMPSDTMRRRGGIRDTMPMDRPEMEPRRERSDSGASFFKHPENNR